MNKPQQFQSHYVHKTTHRTFIYNSGRLRHDSPCSFVGWTISLLLFIDDLTERANLSINVGVTMYCSNSYKYFNLDLHMQVQRRKMKNSSIKHERGSSQEEPCWKYTHPPFYSEHCVAKWNTHHRLSCPSFYYPHYLLKKMWIRCIAHIRLYTL
jgi:hypothetical protein